LPEVWLCWLPVWHPGISLALLIKTDVAGLLSGTRAKVAPAELQASGRQVDEISWFLSPCRAEVIPDRTERIAAARAGGDLPAELSGRGT
jgi:hypothetical protein